MNIGRRVTVYRSSNTWLTRKKNILDGLIVITTFTLLAIMLFPFLWIFVTSLKPERELFSASLALNVKSITLVNYMGLWEAGFARFFMNSLFVCTVAVIISTFLAVLAAYAFSRMHFRGKQSLLTTIAASQMFPWVVLITPIYVLFWKLRFINTYRGLILSYIAITLPYSIYLLLGYFNAISKELDDAASIDGCSTLGTIFRVILPVSTPGLVATATYSFVQAWNEFLFALTFMTRTELKTLPVGLASFFGEYTTEWGKAMAASAITTIPTVLFFLLIQRHLISGLTAGSLKS
ncbi:MAG: carbohydrate ABC transporter permease [Firmicutes bacterium]|nr:carbohydrate ABC transporter permease [Bacillota bacterium]